MEAGHTRWSDDEGVVLRPLTAADEAEAVAGHCAMEPEGFEFLLRWHGQRWDDFMEQVDAEQRGEDLPEGWVPGTFLVADVAGTIVGRTSIRHEFNEFLRTVGGHIGYGVLPGFRGRGYATEILRQSLPVAREVGIRRALVTCDDDNVASARVIEKCGGRLDSVVPGPYGRPKRRYWISTA